MRSLRAVIFAHISTRSVDAHANFIWPGQHACIQEILTHILPRTSPARSLLRLDESRT